MNLRPSVIPSHGGLVNASGAEGNAPDGTTMATVAGGVCRTGITRSLRSPDSRRRTIDDARSVSPDRRDSSCGAYSGWHTDADDDFEEVPCRVHLSLPEPYALPSVRVS